MKKPTISLCLILIGVVTLLAHGLIMIFDYKVVDGWLFDRLISDRNWLALSHFLGMAGKTLEAHFYFLFRIFNNLDVAIRVTSFAAILLSAILSFLILEKIKSFTRGAALGVTLLAVTFPVCKIYGDSSILAYLVAYALYLAGVWVYLLSIAATAKRPTAGFLIATILIYFGFYLNSLLVVHYAVMAVMFVLVKKNQISIQQKGTLYWVVHGVVLGAIPLVFWVVKQVLFPNHGVYSDYNSVDISKLVQMPHGIVQFISIVLLSIDRAMLPFGVSVIGVGIMAGVSIYIWKKIEPILGVNVSESDQPSAFFIVVAGVFLALAAIFPYMIVGQELGYWGFATKNNLLLGLPMSLILFGVARFIVKYWCFLSKKIPYITVFLILGGIVQGNNNYLAWQGNYVIELAVNARLNETHKYKDYSLWVVRDQARIDQTYTTLPASGWTCRFNYGQEKIETFVIEETFIPDNSISRNGLNKRISIADLSYLVQKAGLKNFLNDMDLSRGQAILEILPLPKDKQPVDWVLQYMIYKYFQPAKMNSWLTRQIDYRLIDL